MTNEIENRRKRQIQTFKTAQEKFWAGDFGTSYIDRNKSEKILAASIALFSTALRRTQGIRDCIEFGANIGINLRALQFLYPGLRPYAIEINATAAAMLEGVVPRENIHFISILDFAPKRNYDLVIVKTVLIHINPDCLSGVYEKLYRSCGRYLMICEYYNPTPTMVEYRGYKDRLFKRDFAGEMLDKYRDLSLLDYGFVYHREPNFPQDDVNWFLLEKVSRSGK
jgi:pseudaminic acid biosynthesis-associated methylase